VITVRYDYEPFLIRVSHCDKPLLAYRVIRIVNRQGEWIGKESRCFRERYSVLFKIALGFLWIPLERQSHPINLVSEMMVCTSA
jgi:hypothetical protein